MPIANVHVLKDRSVDTDRVIARWSTFSEISSDEMTINVVEIREQSGRPYDAMAWLHLPTSWTQLEREDLALALGRALAEVMSVATDRVIVLLNTLDRGHMYEQRRAAGG